MMSKEGYGGDVIPHWPSHVMFFYSQTDPRTWERICRALASLLRKIPWSS